MHSLLLALTAFAPIFGADLRGDGSLPGPGTVEYIMEREGAFEEDLRVQALVLGHRKGGAVDELLVSQTFEVLPSQPSRTELQVSEERFREWKQTYTQITTGLRVIPRPGNTRQWAYENLLDPKRTPTKTGVHQVRGRWTPAP